MSQLFTMANYTQFNKSSNYQLHNDKMNVSSHQKIDDPIEIQPANQLNSLEIAKEISTDILILVHNTKGYQKILTIYKNKKSHNYEAFSKHISDILSQDQLSYQNSYKIIQKINQVIKPDVNTAGNQPKSIFDGFAFYWKAKIKPDYEIIKSTLIQDLQTFSFLLVPAIAKFLNQIGTIYDIKLNIIEDVTNYVKKILKKQHLSKKDCICSLMLVSSLKIYEQFDAASLSELAIVPQYNQVSFFFKGIIKHGKQVLGLDGEVLDVQDSCMVDQGEQRKRKLYHYFLDRYVEKCIIKRRIKDIQSMIKQNHRNPNEFPQVMQFQREKFIKYIKRSHRLHFVQLLLTSGDQKCVQKDFQCLCDILIQQDKFRQAMFFIKKYHLEGCTAHKELIRREIKLKPQDYNLRNVLIQKDRFGATELRVLHEVKDFIELQDFGLDQKDVQFIDSDNYEAGCMHKILNSKIVGIDCEKSGGRNPFDPIQVTLAQVSTSGNVEGDRVFLFDVISFSEHQEFKNQLRHFFENYNGKIVGQDVMNDVRELLKELQIKVKQASLKKLQVQDTMLVFRQKFKKQKKCSLDYIANFLFKKPLSKYEQCSGWRNRPLRKAQMHYAALDSYLPIKILQAIKKIK